MFDRQTLISAMRRAGLGPIALANAANVSRSAVWTTINGTRTPSLPVAKRLADALGLDPAALWTDETAR